MTFFFIIQEDVPCVFVNWYSIFGYFCVICEKIVTKVKHTVSVFSHDYVCMNYVYLCNVCLVISKMSHKMHANKLFFLVIFCSPLCDHYFLRCLQLIFTVLSFHQWLSQLRKGHWKKATALYFCDIMNPGKLVKYNEF